ncbi:uncharacterized protein B0T23DRAFT_392550 [Neurospora hispaniola]|uniref:Uncharacterized protein n=1 Tax=Neurospora hispaniola TaxID=588809 RepID=A0AAJ0MVR7_9PEZI|nr:hypothetical protein B0T23DRAFT_392550 [Neurospora hispaniola]
MTERAQKDFLLSFVHCNLATPGNPPQLNLRFTSVQFHLSNTSDSIQLNILNRSPTGDWNKKTQSRRQSSDPTSGRGQYPLPQYLTYLLVIYYHQELLVPAKVEATYLEAKKAGLQLALLLGHSGCCPPRHCAGVGLQVSSISRPVSQLQLPIIVVIIVKHPRVIVRPAHVHIDSGLWYELQPRSFDQPRPPKPTPSTARSSEPSNQLQATRP